jgi:hypothetical protein
MPSIHLQSAPHCCCYPLPQRQGHVLLLRRFELPFQLGILPSYEMLNQMTGTPWKHANSSWRQLQVLCCCSKAQSCPSELFHVLQGVIQQLLLQLGHVWLMMLLW